jgi:peptidoglycan hydrolase CwlO-like protein
MRMLRFNRRLSINDEIEAKTSDLTRKIIDLENKVKRMTDVIHNHQAENASLEKELNCLAQDIGTIH